MSKLLKLKAWVTLDDAAKHLSIMFGEVVSKADVLRLALDRVLPLSIDLVNGATARAGHIVPIEKAKFMMMPQDLKAAMKLGPNDEYKGPYMKFVLGVRLNTGKVIELEDEVLSLRGVYDLSMIGAEGLDVEHAYQALTLGPPVTLQGLDGAFLTDGDGTYFQLQESYDENEFQAGSAARGRMVEERILQEELHDEEAAELRAKHRSERAEFMKKEADKPRKERYFPAGGLPKDAVLVVRTHALMALQQVASAADAPVRSATELGARETNTLFKLLIGMAMAGYKYSPKASRSEVPAEIASDLAKLGIGVTDDTVRKWLKHAAATVLPEVPPAA